MGLNEVEERPVACKAVMLWPEQAPCSRACVSVCEASVTALFT